MLKAKQAGKKLGRPKGEKIKGEDEVLYHYLDQDVFTIRRCIVKKTIENIAIKVGVSKGTVQKIINKYKRNI